MNFPLRCRKENLFFIAASTGNLGLVTQLAAQGAEKEHTFGVNQATALIKAAENKHLDVVRHLVEQGADMEKADIRGWTPLIISTIKGHLDVVRYLLEQGANRDKATNDGYTSLHLAAHRGHLDIAKLLMVYGADLNARNAIGQLPIEMRYLNNEEIKQAIRDEPRRRMDHGHKRAVENSYADQEEEQNNKQSDHDDGDEAEEGEVADEDQESETSSDEEDDGY